MNKLKQIAFIALAIAIFAVLFGCITINPADLNTTAQSQNNSSNGTTNSNSSSTANSNLGSSSGNLSGASLLNLSASEVAKHHSSNDCWMIIEGKVYDLSAYVGHPGGNIYVQYCGIDGTTAYNTLGGRGRDHSAVADSQLAGFLIGAFGQDVNISQAVAEVSQNNANQITYPGIERDEEFEDD